MRRAWLCFAGLVCILTVGRVHPADATKLQPLLAKEIITPRQTQLDLEAYIDARVPRMPRIEHAQDWELRAAELRSRVLKEVVFRGEAAKWRDAKCRTEWLETIKGGPGYRIKKLRYEALPGLWIPALLYEPEQLEGKVPVSLAVNGHEAVGKSIKYKQIRCINQAKRGMLVLNVEWLGMGQLRTPGFAHGRMNQLDLCGASGLAPFYLAMSRGLDVLLALPNADPARVAVSGLSGGGWQTIVLSALDPRVTLCNPVAGYSSFLTRVRHHKDLGDSEQTPCDLATVADYTHLTALLAPRPALLTYNAKDECCFEAGYALPPLLDAAGPIYKLFGKETALRSHVNHDPGTHNYEKDNREAFYRLLGDHWFKGDASWRQEILCDQEVKSREELTVELPEHNLDFQKIALRLATDLPRDAMLPTARDAAGHWQTARRQKLHEVTRARHWKVLPQAQPASAHGDLQVARQRLVIGTAEDSAANWTVPAVEVWKGEPRGTTLVLADGGRASAASEVERLLAAGQRVVVMDPFYLGECQIRERAYLWALLVGTIGDRPLGLQAGQVRAVARSLHIRTKEPVSLIALGPRTSLIALVAAGLEEHAIGSLTLHQSLGSLKAVLEQNLSFEQRPEVFCLGLLEQFDVLQLAALVAPRPVKIREASERARNELAPLKAWYATLGKACDPFAE